MLESVAVASHATMRLLVVSVSANGRFMVALLSQSSKRKFPAENSHMNQQASNWFRIGSVLAHSPRLWPQLAASGPQWQLKTRSEWRVLHSARFAAQRIAQKCFASRASSHSRTFLISDASPIHASRRVSSQEGNPTNGESDS